MKQWRPYWSHTLRQQRQRTKGFINIKFVKGFAVCDSEEARRPEIPHHSRSKHTASSPSAELLRLAWVSAGQHGRLAMAHNNLTQFLLWPHQIKLSCPLRSIPSRPQTTASPPLPGSNKLESISHIITLPLVGQVDVLVVAPGLAVRSKVRISLSSYQQNRLWQKQQ